MRALQLRLLPDPRPLVERLGPGFFRNLPTQPGVYWLEDAAGTVLYVGKARNLRQRLASYRVANPETLPRRRLRLLHLARRIDWQLCADEAGAIAREKELLLTLRPRFNRAGVWPVSVRFLVWRRHGDSLEFRVSTRVDDGWEGHGPGGAGMDRLRQVLVRLLWCGLVPGRDLSDLPAGWFEGCLPECVSLDLRPAPAVLKAHVEAAVQNLLGGRVTELSGWLEATRVQPGSAFSRVALAADLDWVKQHLAPDEGLADPWGPPGPDPGPRLAAPSAYRPGDP